MIKGIIRCSYVRPLRHTPTSSCSQFHNDCSYRADDDQLDDKPDNDDDKQDEGDDQDRHDQNTHKVKKSIF